jgi:riboflavin kinase/FMN adenylyltransferase
MRIIRHKEELNGQPVVATVGFFDGVHQGHRYLIEEVRKQGFKCGLPSAVITFPQHPRAVLQQDYQPRLLNSFDEKLERLAETGIDYCIVIDFTPAFSRLTAKDFLQKTLAGEWLVKILLAGYDHSFGYNREEGFEQYFIYGKECGIEVIKAASYAGVSSSGIRRELALGNVEKAARYLTYPYRIKGKIISGKQLGRRLGFPTANIRLEESFKELPAAGVYAVKVSREGDCHNGLLYIGTRPTLDDGDEISMEVNLFDFSDDLYNNELTVSFFYHIRTDRKFGSLDALREQLEKDRDTAKQLLARHGRV